MPRSLDFTFQDDQFSCELNTVNRSKLYGSVIIETLDQEGRRCELATLAVDGKTLIPNGGTASAYVNEDGDWISRKGLVAVDRDGGPLATVESSFDQPVTLSNTVTEEQFLDHSIRLIYRLEPEGEISSKLEKSLNEGQIYRFEFSYRGGVKTDPAFILMDERSLIWMLVAQVNDIQFTGLEQAAVCAVSAEVDIDEGEDDQELDFSML